MATKYGDKAALEHAATTLREHGVGVLYDVVFNHKLGADEKEQVHVFKVDANNRNDIDDRASTRWPTPASPFPAAGRAFRVYLGLHMLQRRRLR